MKALRQALEPRVRRWWQDGSGMSGVALSLLAAPPQVLYRSVLALQELAYQHGLRSPDRAPIPIVSVGNLVVGGTGKTPVTAWVARRLEALGARPAVLLRGYGDDEALLHHRWNPDMAVVTHSDRLRAARMAAERGATVAVLDDGFQHRRLARDLDLVLVAAEQRFPGRLLPRGPYREGPSALARAHLIAVTRRTAGDAEVEDTLQRLAPFATRPPAVLRLAACGWTDLAGGPAEPPRGPLLAVAGLAGPALFGRLAAQLTGEDVELLAFPDHHPYDLGDARRISRAAGERTVVVTEKDAVKLSLLQTHLPALRVLTLAVHAESGEETIEAALRGLVTGAEP